MTTWKNLKQEQPELAEAGLALLYHFGVGLGFLATVRSDGGPRVHPMCPLLTDEGLFAFIVPGPKQRDLLRDGRFSLHSFPQPGNEDAFYVTGRASSVHGTAIREALSAQFVTERSSFDVPPAADDHLLFELLVDRCLLTRTTGHGDHSPAHTVWPAPGRS